MASPADILQVLVVDDRLAHVGLAAAGADIPFGSARVDVDAGIGRVPV